MLNPSKNSACTAANQSFFGGQPVLSSVGRNIYFNYHLYCVATETFPCETAEIMVATGYPPIVIPEAVTATACYIEPQQSNQISVSCEISNSKTHETKPPIQVNNDKNESKENIPSYETNKPHEASGLDNESI